MALMSAQELLNGPGFDDDFILDKAERELRRVKVSVEPLAFYYDMMNFAISVAMVADWKFQLHLSDTRVWTAKKDISEINFTHWVRSQSPEIGAFIDISNECKHANRDYPSFLAKKVLLSPIWKESEHKPEELAEFSAFGLKFGTDKGPLLIVPLIEYGGNKDYFFRAADKAINWWKTVDITKAVPLDKNLNSK